MLPPHGVWVTEATSSEAGSQRLVGQHHIGYFSTCTVSRNYSMLQHSFVDIIQLGVICFHCSAYRFTRWNLSLEQLCCWRVSPRSQVSRSVDHIKYLEMQCRALRIQTIFILPCTLFKPHSMTLYLPLCLSVSILSPVSQSQSESQSLPVSL